jgi:hypothetical protein
MLWLCNLNQKSEIRYTDLNWIWHAWQKSEEHSSKATEPDSKATENSSSYCWITEGTIQLEMFISVHVVWTFQNTHFKSCFTQYINTELQHLKKQRYRSMKWHNRAEQSLTDIITLSELLLNAYTNILIQNVPAHLDSCHCTPAESQCNNSMPRFLYIYIYIYHNIHVMSLFLSLFHNAFPTT